MNKKTFTAYCAKVMGYELYDFTFAVDDKPRTFLEGGSVEYNPYDDMNQLVVVVDALMKTHRFLIKPSAAIDFMDRIDEKGMVVAWREFVWSTR